LSAIARSAGSRASASSAASAARGKASGCSRYQPSSARCIGSVEEPIDSGEGTDATTGRAAAIDEAMRSNSMVDIPEKRRTSPAKRRATNLPCYRPI
jgi:hypothetical protein